MASVFSPSQPLRVLFWRRLQEVASRPVCCAAAAAAAAPRIRRSGPALSAVSALGLHGRSSLLSGYRSLPPFTQHHSFSFLFFSFFFAFRLLLVFFWDYIFFWWFFNSNSMHRKWVNCTRNMVSFVFFFFFLISLREITAPLLLLLLLRYFRVTLFIVSWLSFLFSLSLKPQFVNRGRAQKVSALLFRIVYIFYTKVFDYFSFLEGGQFVNSHTVRLCENGKHECSVRTCSL